MSAEVLFDDVHERRLQQVARVMRRLTPRQRADASRLELSTLLALVPADEGEIDVPVGLDDWIPLAAAYAQMARQFPALGRGTSKFAASRFATVFYEPLQRRGAVMKVGRRWLASRRLFAQAAMEVLMEADVSRQ